MDKKYNEIGKGLSGGIFASEVGMNAGGVTVSRVLCDKTVFVDVGGDHELPDHMSEIVKLIKVDVRPSAPSEFISGNGAQINGSIEYSVIYLGGDGEMHCAVFPDKYSVSVPLEEGGARIGSDKISVSARVYPDNTVSRVSGSSGINIKCSLGIKVLIMCDELRDGGLVSMQEPNVYKLIKNCPSCRELRGSKDDVVLSFKVDTSGAGTKYLSSDCKVFVTDTACGDGYVDCRGYASVRHLMSRGGEMWTVTDKIPFSETVDLDGVSSGGRASVLGICTGISNASETQFNDTDERTALSVGVCLDAVALMPCSLDYVKDMYSTVYDYGLEYEKKTMPIAIACKNGNITFSGREELSEIGMNSEMLNVIDVAANARADGIDVEDDGYVMKGRCRFTFVYSCGDSGEMGSCECELPFRYEFEGDGGDAVRFDVSISAIEPRARLEGSRMAFDCELAISLFAVGEKEISAVVATKPERKKREKENGFTVCYPDVSDSLWSVAKRYGASLEDAAKENGMDGYGDADETGLPDGVKYMII